MLLQACQLQHPPPMSTAPPPPLLSSSTIILSHNPKPLSHTKQTQPIQPSKLFSALLRTSLVQNPDSIPSILSAGVAIALIASTASQGTAIAAELPSLGSSLQFSEPKNALSLPTWAIHVSSVVEWITAMVLVWQYGEKSGYESWKGLSWGMVPLLGGAFCACTWHFFYNSESLEVLVALQAALTVIGNFTMCIAAFRIYQSSKGGSENL